MLKSVIRVSYQVPDIQKACRWYKELLGIEPVLDSPFLTMFVMGEAALILIPSDNGSDSSKVQASNSQAVAYWKVDDIQAAYRRLLDLGASSSQEITTFLDISVARVIDPFGNVIGITGQTPKDSDRSVEHQPSESALTVALCRALAFLDEHQEIKGGDYLAEIFLREDGKRTLRDKASRDFVVNKLLTVELYSYFLARTAYMDNIFLSALKDNIPQIVLLGAGYDSRPYRFSDHIRNTRIYELDVPATQQRKRTLLENAGVKIPGQMTYIPVNFNSETIEDVISGSSYNKNVKTLFIWEGVTYYLPEEAVSRTLSFIRNFSRPHSTLCFDYLLREIKSAYTNEPFLFWKTADEMKSFLSDHQFNILEHIDAGMMQSRFLTLKDGSSAGRVLPLFCFAMAENR